MMAHSGSEASDSEASDSEASGSEASGSEASDSEALDSEASDSEASDSEASDSEEENTYEKQMHLENDVNYDVSYYKETILADIAKAKENLEKEHVTPSHRINLVRLPDGRFEADVVPVGNDESMDAGDRIAIDYSSKLKPHTDDHIKRIHNFIRTLARTDGLGYMEGSDKDILHYSSYMVDNKTPPPEDMKDIIEKCKSGREFIPTKSEKRKMLDYLENTIKSDRYCHGKAFFEEKYNYKIKHLVDNIVSKWNKFSEGSDDEDPPLIKANAIDILLKEEDGYSLLLDHETVSNYSPYRYGRYLRKMRYDWEDNNGNLEFITVHTTNEYEIDIHFAFTNCPVHSFLVHNDRITTLNMIRFDDGVLDKLSELKYRFNDLEGGFPNKQFRMFKHMYFTTHINFSDPDDSDLKLLENDLDTFYARASRIVLCIEQAEERGNIIPEHIYED